MNCFKGIGFLGNEMFAKVAVLPLAEFGHKTLSLKELSEVLWSYAKFCGIST